MKTTKFLLLSVLASSFLLSQQKNCDLLFCGNFKSLQEVHSPGDRIAFGINMAQIEGFYELTNTNAWKNWTDVQYGVREHVKLVRYIYDKTINGKTLVIETFYNHNRGEFLFGRVLYQGNYNNMMNFIMKKYYQNTRTDFSPEEKFTDNSNNKYFDNADVLLKSLTGYIESM